MSATVRLSLKAAKALASEENVVPGLDAALRELRAALAKASRASATRRTARKPKAAKHKAKREARQEVRAEVARRADGMCEACDWAGLGLELDHFHGRARAESLEACWLLCRVCHRQKTNNHPSAASWLGAFAAHCAKHGYTQAEARARKRLAFVEARGAP